MQIAFAFAFAFAFSRDDKQCGFVVMPFQDVNRLKSGYPVRRLVVPVLVANST